MKNTPTKKSTAIGLFQLAVHFLLVIPIYWALGKKKTHQAELADAELSFWAKTRFGKSNKEIYQDLLQEDSVAAAQFFKACALKGYPIQ